MEREIFLPEGAGISVLHEKKNIHKENVKKTVNNFFIFYIRRKNAQTVLQVCCKRVPVLFGMPIARL